MKFTYSGQAYYTLLVTHLALGKNYLLHLKRSKESFRNTLFLESLIAFWRKSI